MKTLIKLLPWFCLALFGAEIAALIAPKQDGDFHWREFGRLPVLHSGRIQPFDSLARNALLQIRSTGDVPLEEVPSWKFWHHPKKLKSTEWLLEVLARPEVADTRPIFLIHHADVLGELKLQDSGVEKSGLRYYTFKQLEPVIKEIEAQGQKAGQVKAEDQTSFQKQILKLANAAELYKRLKATLQPEGVDDFPGLLAGLMRDLPAAIAAATASEKGLAFDTNALRQAAQPFRQFQFMDEAGYAPIVPPLDPAKAREGWQTVGASVVETYQTGQLHPAVRKLAVLATAFRKGQAAEFNQAVADYRAWLQPNFERELGKGRAEFFYNDAKPFLHAMIIYIFALVAGAAGLATFSLFPNLSESLRRSSLYLIILAGVVHTFGLIFRMVLEGRPPVTNLYSSAIFIGWAAMITGIILERLYRVGIGNLVASAAGFVTLMIAHNLALGGDTMEMLRAVLDTNFWLATHVVVITLGYAATFAAGAVAIIYILLGRFTPLLMEPLRAADGSVLKMGGAPATIGKALSRMTYGIVCFATLFSFVGTVLGGIWADQSWGRFWGWDPKENGALLIVLWNAVILHARWGGLARDRGIMNLAVFGNIVTGFSWFGVNLLGIGLHSYGFTDSGFKWLMLFFGTQVAIIVLGLVPLSRWRSFRSKPAGTAPPPGGSPVGPTPARAAG